MQTLIIVNSSKDWAFDIPGVRVVSARSYLTEEEFIDLRKVRIFNLCKSYRYQSTGYYVSLLAAARGHRPLPDVNTIQDMKSQTIIRYVSDDLDKLIQDSLAPIKSDEFTLSIYFGKNMAKRYDKLCRQLYNMFQAPIIRAKFSRNAKWQLQSLGPVSMIDIPEDHKAFITEAAREYLAGKKLTTRRKAQMRYDMAILWNAEEKAPPSDEKAIQNFVKAGEQLGIGVEVITRDDYNRLAEFDALFIRETTNVNHHTYRFARRAKAEGLVVVDDPDSILKCTNKVYLAELLDRHSIPAPKTLIIHRDNTDRIIPELGLPCILKQPDSSFSQGVLKASTPAELTTMVEMLLDKSDLVIAQQFMPTEYDWRIGIMDGKPLFACRYFMAKKHWQIIKTDTKGDMSFGKSETLPWEMAPQHVMRTALKAANLIGNSFYGVDIKQSGNKCYLIEVNDNPNLDSGVEDLLLKDELYNRIMQIFYNRIKAIKEGR
jgi:glutathione synthase/RimK-type ligase-like ATP-grasp enzyme